MTPGTTLYHGQRKGRNYKSSNGAVFFTPSLNYAKNYGDEIYSAKVPSNLFDIFNKKSDFNKLKSWLSQKIKEIGGEKIGANSIVFYKDAKKYVETDSPDELVRAMVNYGIASAGGFSSYKVGQVEKQFMEENGISAMTMKEAGSDIPDEQISVVFKDVPKMAKVDFSIAS